MPELQLLRAEHAAALLRFEFDNRAYFAAWISDRGDEFYARFDQRHDPLLADQTAGLGAYYLLVADDDSVLGRFNLSFDDGDAADLGYRVAESVTGRGLATRTVREVCALAAAGHGRRRVTAAASTKNVASQRVLINAGFTLVGAAEPTQLGGKTGFRYELLLNR